MQADDGAGGPKQQSSAQPLPRLRQELSLLPGTPDSNGEISWLIYDPVRHRYFQISETAFELLSLWKEIDVTAFANFASSELGREVTQSEVNELRKFLFAGNLTDEAPDGDSLAFARQVAGARRTWWQNIVHNYLFFRVPLVRPHLFLSRTLPFVLPLYSRRAAWTVLAITLVGMYLASRQWELFVATFLDFLSLEGMLLYGLSLVFLKILHELGHAYTATRSGVRVNTMGVAFMVLMPILYTDVTDAWRLRSRRDRLAIDAAGMTVELAVAGIATFLWAFLPDGPARSVAFVVATTSWIMSLAVNLNPFMRFDGYYLLSDAWGIPNLQARSNAIGRWWLREALFGLKEPEPERFPITTRNLLAAYAFGVWLYRLILFIGIALLVYHMFFKALGVVLFAIEIIWFILLPIWRELQEWWKMRSKVVLTSRSLVTAGVAAAVLAASIVPWSGTVRLPAVSLAGSEALLYAPRPARIERITLVDDMQVEAGATLAVMSAPELDFEIAQTARRIAHVEARLARIAGDSAELSRRVVLESERATLMEKASGLRAEARRLTIIAPHGGVVRDADLDLGPGQWIDATTAIARVVGTSRAEVQGYVHEDDIWRIEAGQSAWFVPEDPLLASRRGKLVEVAQAGTQNLELQYLSSVYGGAIASDRNDKGELRPRSGRYLVRIELEGAPFQRAVPGVIHVSGRPESTMAALWRRILQVVVRESGL